jgi:hypothetical protein
MVEISLSGSGEGPGWATAPGYSTGGVQAGARPASHGVRPQRVGDPSVGRFHEEGVVTRCGRAMGSEVSIHVLPGPGTPSRRPYG